MTRTRSIGARSDWSEKKDGGETEDGDGDDGPSNGRPEAPSRTWSIYHEDGDDAKNGMPKHPEDDPEDPINKYVSDQLARIKSNESHEYAEELAASNDGANDDL